ncbi:hypothetical protein MMC13_005410 [Lambiella insularis]|nr:hypothetical protein [Lambiella insularis]
MSGLEVIGGISAVIAIVETCVKIYNGARKDLKLSDTFRAVARRLPVLVDTFNICKSHLNFRTSQLTKDVCAALESILENCEGKAQNLRSIFEKVILHEADGWEQRYIKIVRRLGKGNKVEEFMKSITEDVQHVVNHEAVQSVRPEQSQQLDSILRDLRGLESSTADDDKPLSAHSINERQYINRSEGQQFNYENMTGTQHFDFVLRQKEDFSYNKPCGVCLDQAPYVNPRLFIGLTSDEADIHDHLHSDATDNVQHRLVLSGLGGIGKTQLAIEYAKRYHQNYDSVLWFNATSEVTVKASLRSMAGRIFTLQNRNSLVAEQALSHVKRWLADAQNTRWLLLFDNYDEPKSYEIGDYIPFTDHGSIIITTRMPSEVGGEKVAVRPLDDVVESLQILETRSRRQSLASDEHAWLLAKRLAGLPLALNINPRRPVKLAEYQDRTLYTTWDISYERLANEDQEAAELLKLLAYFDHQEIWHELLEAGVSDAEAEWLRAIATNTVKFENIMTVLVDYCFLETLARAESYGMHTCVHDWTLAVLNPKTEIRSYTYAFRCVAMSISSVDWQLFGQVRFARLVPHAVTLTHARFLETLKTVALERVGESEGIGQLLREQVQLGAAEQIYEQALAGKEKALGAEHTSTLSTVNNLANFYYHQGKLNEAEQIYERALAGYEKALGAEHPSTLGTVNNLGVLYSDQGKLNKAEQILKRALAGYEKALGSEHTLVLRAVNNLIILYQEQGKPEIAEQLSHRFQIRDTSIHNDK